MNTFQPPHYCTHAIEQLRRHREGVLSIGQDVSFEELLGRLLEQAVKFLLPDNGKLFADSDYKPSMFELQRLPFPVCALEFAADETLYAADSGLAQSTRRIALAFDPNALDEHSRHLLDDLRRGGGASMPERCIAIISVYESHQLWCASVGLVVIDLDEDAPVVVGSAQAREFDTGLLGRVAERLGQPGRTKHGLPATFMLFPERARLLGHSLDLALEALIIDTIDETRVVYEFLAALNCANVGTQRIPAPKMLNSKRLKKGKAPFYDYQVLDLRQEEPDTPTAGGARGHGAPRTHLRRGHLRRLGERYGHKVLWINATVVNARPGDDPGAVYKVKR